MISLVCFFAKTQFTIYRQYLSLKVSGEVIPGELSRNQLQLTYDELMATTGSYEFHSHLAKLIVASPRFEEMSFTSLKAKSLKTWKDDFGSCLGVPACEIERVAGLVGQHIDLKKGASPDRYTYQISALDANTINIMTPLFIKAIQEFRVKTIQAVYANQQKLVEEMLENSRMEMSSKGGMEALNQIKSNELELQELKEKISGLQNTINADASALSIMEFKLKETHSLARGMDVGESEKLKAEKLRRKQAKMNDLRQNIAALNSLPEADRTPSDQMVLKQIQQELLVIEAEIQKISSHTIRFSEKENFNTVQQSYKNNLDFDYNVLKKKLNQEKSEHEALTKEAQALIEENISLENDSSSLKQDVEAIKALDSRLVTIKMMISTAESDMIFETYGEGLDEFQRSSQTQNLLFSFIISFGIVFIVLLVRYFFDDRIYEEHEIRKCFKDLPIIGKTPDFD